MKTITENLSKIILTHEVGKTAEEATLELGGLGGYLPGEEVLLKVGGQDRKFLVEGTSNELSASGGQGWVQNLHLLSPLWVESKRSPKKTQIFLTLSPSQYDEFQSALGGQAGQYSSLQYHPWVRLGNDYGEGGWDSNEMIKVLGGLGGLTIHSSLPSYWVRQFTIEPHTSFLEAIMKLVAPLEPFFYSVGGHIFITERGALEEELGGANRLSLSGVRMVRQEVQRKEKPSQIRLVGNLGRFRPERFKGPLQSEPLQEVWEGVGTYSIKNYSYGAQRESFIMESGGVPFQDVPRVFSLGMGITADPDSGIINDFSREEVSVLRGRDIFGNPSIMISETRTTYRHRVFASGLIRPVLYARAKTAIQYENTHYSFAAPRELGSVVGRPTSGGLLSPGRISSLDLSVFYPAGGRIVYDLYPNIEETLTYYWYSPSGELVAQNTTVIGVVYTEDGLSFKELKFMSKDELSPWGSLRRVVVRQETISYYQISRDSYGVRREVVSLNTQGRYTSSVDVQIVQSGAVQGSPVEPRRMETYAESGAYQPGSTADAQENMPTPAQEVSINTPSWESLEALLPQFQKRLAKDELLRVYELLGELNVHPGLQVELQAVSNLDGTETISVPALDPDFVPIVVGYEVEKDLITGKAITRLFVRGRLA